MMASTVAAINSIMVRGVPVDFVVMTVTVSPGESPTSTLLRRRGSAFADASTRAPEMRSSGLGPGGPLAVPPLAMMPALYALIDRTAR